LRQGRGNPFTCQYRITELRRRKEGRRKTGANKEAMGIVVTKIPDRSHPVGRETSALHKEDV
jgi:hypothetical protein